jgi:hypothetical protein
MCGESQHNEEKKICTVMKKIKNYHSSYVDANRLIVVNSCQMMNNMALNRRQPHVINIENSM